MKRALTAAVMAGALVCVASASAQAAPVLKPRMSQHAALLKAEQRVARDKLAFHTRQAGTQFLSWAYACGSYAQPIAQYYESYRWYVNSGGAHAYAMGLGSIIQPDASYQRAPTWWRCNVYTYPVVDNTTLAPIVLRIEVAGNNTTGITGTAIACEELQQGDAVLTQIPTGCSVTV